MSFKILLRFNAYVYVSVSVFVNLIPLPMYLCS
jgi:hypothetical protein